MIGRSRAALGRLSPRAGAIGLAVLVIGAAVLVLPTHEVGERSRRPSTRPTAKGATPGAVKRPSPVPSAQLARARGVARTFIEGYLRLAYGRAGWDLVPAVTPNLRGQLRHDHALVTPVERGRRPRVVSLTAIGTAPGVVLATALVDDGGIAAYSLRLTLRETSLGWLVSGIDDG